MTSTISIIIPTLNEAKNLPVLQVAARQVDECIIVDGGSSDNTVQVAKELGFVTCTNDKGRGAQLNVGAAHATSSLLLFLHADTILPPDFPNLITTCLSRPETTLGAFSLHIEPSTMGLRFIAAGANFRSRHLHLPYGDQALFMRKTDFHACEGFPEHPIMEDYIFIRQLKKKGEIETLKQTVSTSARRWQKVGPIRTTAVNQLMILGYHLGIPLKTLATLYRKDLLFRKRSGNKGTHTIG